MQIKWIFCCLKWYKKYTLYRGLGNDPYKDVTCRYRVDAIKVSLVGTLYYLKKQKQTAWLSALTGSSMQTHKIIDNFFE